MGGAGWNELPYQASAPHCLCHKQHSTHLVNARAELLDGGREEGLFLLIDLADRENLFNTGFLFTISLVASCDLICHVSSCTHAELNVDRKVANVGANLLLDGLTTSVGAEVDVRLDGLDGAAAVRGLEDKLGKFGTG